MKLVVKIGLETDSDYSLLHPEQFEIRWDRDFAIRKLSDCSTSEEVKQ